MISILAFFVTYLSASDIVQLTDKNYDSFIKNNSKPVFVKFWAPWCKPCQIMAPRYEEIAKRYEGKLIFTELNIDKFARFSVLKKVRAVPTVVLYKNGEELDRLTMVLNIKQLDFWANEAIKKEYRFKKKTNIKK